MEKTEKTSVDLAMAATSVTGPTNKAAAHWARKIYNRKLRKTGILDTGATSGAAPEEDEDCFVVTGIPSTKIFMFPDKRTNKATKKMLMKHNLFESAREMNIMPGLHSTLISVPKLADAGYTMVFTKKVQQFTMITLQKSQPASHGELTPTDATTLASGSSHLTTRTRRITKAHQRTKPSS
jgi:hypothetical protein